MSEREQSPARFLEVATMTYLLFWAGCDYYAPKLSDLATRQRSCKALISTYQSALERSFEVELNSLRSPDDLRRDWYKALKAIQVETRDVDGRYRDPTHVVLDVVSNLSKVSSGDDRRRLEYVLLGSAMPLEARREFEKVCVEAAF